MRTCTSSSHVWTFAIDCLVSAPTIAILDLILRSTGRRSASHDKPVCGVITSLSLSQSRLSNQASSCRARGTFLVLTPCTGQGYIREAGNGRQIFSKSCAHSSLRHSVSASITAVKFRPKPLLYNQFCTVSAFAILKTSTDVMALNNEDGKYTGSEMDYTYGDAKQKMQSRTDDFAILLRKLPSHAMSLAYDFINNRHHPSKNVCSAYCPNKAILT